MDLTAVILHIAIGVLVGVLLWTLSIPMLWVRTVARHGTSLERMTYDHMIPISFSSGVFISGVAVAVLTLLLAVVGGKDEGTVWVLSTALVVLAIVSLFANWIIVARWVRKRATVKEVS